MTASVHDAGIARAVGLGADLADGQGVHVCADSDAAALAFAFEQGDYTCDGHAFLHFETKCAKLVGHHFGGANLLIGQFRIRMQITPDLD